MTDEDARKIQGIVQDTISRRKTWRKLGSTRRKAPITSQKFSYPVKELSSLWEKIRDDIIDQFPSLDLVDLYVTAAMCWLGPKGMGIPPQNIRQQLQAKIPQLPKQVLAKGSEILDATIAFGCGKWRNTKQGHGGWYHIWPEAYSALALLIEPAEADMYEFLNRQLLDNFKKYSGSTPAMDAPLIAGIMRQKPSTYDSVQYIIETNNYAIQKQEANNCIQTLFVEPGSKLSMFSEKGVLLTGIDRSNISIEDVFSQLQHGHEDTQIKELKNFLSVRFSAPTQIVISGDEETPRITIREYNKKERRIEMDTATNSFALVFSPNGLSIPRCRCGSVRCHEMHSLDGWDPLKVDKKEKPVSLLSFVSSAVKGGVRKIGIHSLGQSMFAALYTDSKISGRIHIGLVEHHLCNCSSKGQIFKGDMCPHCNQSFDETKMLRILKDAVIFPPYYTRRDYYRCDYIASKKIKFYHIGLVCPICKKPNERVERIVKALDMHINPKIPDLGSQIRKAIQEKGSDGAVIKRSYNQVATRGWFLTQVTMTSLNESEIPGGEE